MDDFVLTASLFLQTSAQMGTPILLATLGGILSEKVGHLNLGVEGMMLMGAVMGFLAGVGTQNPVIALLSAGLAGAFGALIYAFVTVTLRGNHVVTGLALTVFGTGVSGFFGKTLTGLNLPETVKAPFAPFQAGVLSDIPFIGKMFFEQGIYVHLGLVLAVVIYILFKHTRVGLNLRAVGENPAAADASGIHVTAYKYVSILCGGFLCGLGGAYLSLVFVPRWQDNITAGLGWIAVALIIFATWNPLKAIFGAYLFGALRGIGFKLQNLDINVFGHDIVIAPQFLDMIPYATTILVLVFITMRKKKENQAPASLGNPYFREDR